MTNPSRNPPPAAAGNDPQDVSLGDASTVLLRGGTTDSWEALASESRKPCAEERDGFDSLTYSLGTSGRSSDFASGRSGRSSDALDISLEAVLERELSVTSWEEASDELAPSPRDSMMLNLGSPASPRNNTNITSFEAEFETEASMPDRHRSPKQKMLDGPTLLMLAEEFCRPVDDEVTGPSQRIKPLATTDAAGQHVCLTSWLLQYCCRPVARD